MPTSPLKRTSGGRLRRLLASLRPPAHAGPLPVRTGFPTSLADIVVKNHGRLRNPRRRHRAAAAAAEPAPVSEQRRELSVANDAAAAPAVPMPTRRRGAGAADLSIRPGLLGAGAAVALAMLVVWSKQLVAVATLAAVAMSWIEYVRTGTVRPRRPETEEEEVDSRRRRVCVSPIRDREAAESPRPSCGSGSDDGGSGDLGCDDSSSPVTNPKLKQRRRSLRKLVASKLRNGKTPRSTDSRHGGDAGEHPSAGEINAETAAAAVAAAEATAPAPPPEAIADDDRWHSRCGRRYLPLPALVPIILAGLVAGKLPALVLVVLCVAFFSPVQ